MWKIAPARCAVFRLWSQSGQERWLIFFAANDNSDETQIAKQIGLPSIGTPVDRSAGLTGFPSAVVVGLAGLALAGFALAGLALASRRWVDLDLLVHNH